MVIIGPLLSLGIGQKKTLLIALLTGVVEVVGTLLGYFFIAGFSSLLPFALSFAGGTMVYVIYAESSSGDAEEQGRLGMFFLLGAVLMLLFSAVI
jgi:ZIP family zinc transporter